MLDAGEDVKSLQMNLGHSSAAFTLNQYAHVSQKMRMQSSKRMNDYCKFRSNKAICTEK